MHRLGNFGRSSWLLRKKNASSSTFTDIKLLTTVSQQHQSQEDRKKAFFYIPKTSARKTRANPDACRVFTGMELVFLGTGAGGSSIERNSTSLALQLDSQIWLFDVGEGTLTQLMKSNLNTGTISSIFVTHLHGDHIFGLPSIICDLDQNVKFDQLNIYGPSGLFHYLNSVLTLSYSGIHNLKITVHELVSEETLEEENHAHKCLNFIQHHKALDRKTIFGVKNEHNIYEWDVVKDKHRKVVASSLLHTVPCFGYVVEENARNGKFNVALAKSRGLKPGPAYKQLENGKSVLLPDGSYLHPHEVIGKSKAGRKVVILGDTCSTENFIRIGNNADVVVHEATLQDSMIKQATERGHSTPSMAGEFAKKLNAVLLVLTHISSKFSSKNKNLVDVLDLQIEARKKAKKNAILVAEDFLRIRIPRRT